MQSRLWGAGALISRDTFLLVCWCGFSIATICVIGRIAMRLKVFKRLGLDDFLVLFAWIGSAAYSIEWHVKSVKLWAAIAQMTGVVPMDESYLEYSYSFITAQTGAIVCTYLGLWAVKYSFLFFFKDIGSQFRQQRVLWQIVTVYVSIGLPVTLAVMPWKCHETQNLEKTLEKCSTPAVSRFTMIALKTQATVDITTDAAILLIPFTILYQIRLTVRRKIALACLFSLSLINILCVILRVSIVEMTAVKSYIDVTWLFLWYKIELDTAITIACLASFRALYTSKRSERSRDCPTQPFMLPKKSKCVGIPTRDCQALQGLQAVESIRPDPVSIETGHLNIDADMRTRVNKG